MKSMEASVLSIDEELQNCIAQLSLSRKKSILGLIKSFAKNEDAEMKPQTLEEYNREIEEAEKRIEAGEFYTHEQVTEMAKNW